MKQQPAGECVQTVELAKNLLQLNTKGFPPDQTNQSTDFMALWLLDTILVKRKITGWDYSFSKHLAYG